MPSLVGGLLGGRRRSEPVPAHYVRILDGEHLWLALAGDPPSVTLRYDGGELVTPTEPETGALVSARVPLGPLAEVPGDAVAVTVLAGDGRHTAPISWSERPAPGPVRAAIPTRDRRRRWRVVAPDGLLGLVREAVEPGMVVAAISERPDGSGVDLLLADGSTVTVAAVTDELSADGLPLVRAHDDLKRPNYAVALPELADGSRLRWSPEGRLLLAARDA